MHGRVWGARASPPKVAVDPAWLAKASAWIESDDAATVHAAAEAIEGLHRRAQAKLVLFRAHELADEHRRRENRGADADDDGPASELLGRGAGAILTLRTNTALDVVFRRTESAPLSCGPSIHPENGKARGHIRTRIEILLTLPLPLGPLLEE
jgi:hypothetical protein